MNYCVLNLKVYYYLYLTNSFYRIFTMLKNKVNNVLTQMLGIDFPIIMAPMFLVSNASMVIEATKSGITGAIPALNYRTDEEFRRALDELKSKCEGPFGINLIVNKSNIRLKEQLETCLEYKVDFIITSLGNPAVVIQKCKPLGIKVFCDVTEENYAKKVEALGADAVIAVNREAGGHAGKIPAKELIPRLKEHCNIPIISAGGVATGQGIAEVMSYGACGVSVGSMFIASEEAPVSPEYKQAIVDHGASDIVMTTRLSGTPCTIINTPYVQKVGLDQNRVEKFLSRNKWLKKYVKLFTFLRGMKTLRKATFEATYKTMWCAGPSIQYVHNIRPVKQIVNQLIEEYDSFTSKNG